VLLYKWSIFTTSLNFVYCGVYLQFLLNSFPANIIPFTKLPSSIVATKWYYSFHIKNPIVQQYKNL